MDIVTAIKHIRKNAEKYLIDPDKICLYGFQGGGYVMSAACSLLGLKNEGHLVRLAIINMSIKPALFFTDKKEDMPHKSS